jgi:hypothetical protein
MRPQSAVVRRAHARPRSAARPQSAVRHAACRTAAIRSRPQSAGANLRTGKAAQVLLWRGATVRSTDVGQAWGAATGVQSRRQRPRSASATSRSAGAFVKKKPLKAQGICGLCGSKSVVRWSDGTVHCACCDKKRKEVPSQKLQRQRSTCMTRGKTGAKVQKPPQPYCGKCWSCAPPFQSG